MAQMKWYTTLRNAINTISIPKDHARAIAVGQPAIVKHLAAEIRDHQRALKRPCLVALDGYLGAECEGIVRALVSLLAGQGLCARAVDVEAMYKPRKQLDRMMEKYLTPDPSFGRACSDTHLRDLLDGTRIEKLRRNLLRLKQTAPQQPAVFFCYGIGSAALPLRRLYDRVYFFDLSQVSVMKKKFAGTLREPGVDKPQEIFWKRLCYVYYHMLNRHRREVISIMDGYIDGNEEGRLKFMPRKAYDSIVQALLQIPLKFRRFMQPGNWGGLKHRKYFNLPQLANCAWDTTFYAPKNSCLVDAGIGCHLEIPFLNIQLQYPEYVCGPYLAGKYPGLLPMIACIDDGYFPKPVPPERSNMPIHLHPDGNYIRQHFNERLGRYETYYIVEAYEHANTMLGLRTHADKKEFKRQIVAAETQQIKFDWTRYVKTWPSKKGDLYLIPAGTVHGTGGHQMILEMDTCPSNAGTEYSFFLYDYLRPSWDDDKKSFSAPPVRLQTRHGFGQARWQRREAWVKQNLLAKPTIVRKGPGWSEDRYTSFGPMPFLIERLHFRKKIEADTRGRFCHIVVLTEGDRVLIRSKREPRHAIELEWIQLALIPAGFGPYECINIGKSAACTLVKQRWKRG